MKAGPAIPDVLCQQSYPAALAATLALIQHSKQRLADLEARFNQKSTNSSEARSSDPPARLLGPQTLSPQELT
jgi:hypothetical protein